MKFAKMINPILVVIWGCLLGRLQAFALQHREELNVTTPPVCATTCFITLIPQYCESLTNLTCVCTDPDLTVALASCALSACNVTDSLRLENYRDRTCGIENDKTHQHDDMRLHIVLTPLVGLFILARVFIRFKNEGCLGLDDWSMILAGAFYMASVGIAFPITIMGYGQHTWYLSTDIIILSLKFFYISELLYGLTLTFTKLSLLLFFRRVFPNKSIQTGTLVVGAFVIASNISVIVTMLTQCFPVRGMWTNWMYKEPPIKCVNSFVIVIFFASLSIFQDLVILAMPLPILWGLQLNWKRKAHAMIMFSVGVFVIICSSLRVPILTHMRHTMDPSYDQAPVALWSYLEQAVGIICGCLPAFRSLLGFLFPKLRKTLGSTGDGGSKSTSSGSHNRSIPSPLDKNSSRYHEGDIELGRKGIRDSSQEQIVYRDDRTSDESSHFRLVPMAPNGDKLGTRVTVTAAEGDAIKAVRFPSLYCPKKAIKDSRHESSVTYTVDVMR